jgi:hypothetical protein
MNIFKVSYLIFSILFLFQSPSFTLRAESIVAADIVEGTKTSKNYLKAKSHFEKTANGWNGYDDGGATRPVNGTGGTVTTTCTRTTSSPLSGVGSLIMTKGAANYQGEGCSVDFTVDTKDKAKVLQVEFDYIVSSGTFTAGTSSTDSDVIVYLYDVDNSTLIEPSSFKLLSSSTTIADKFIGNFQTSSSGVNYRLMFHIASSSNTSSMVLKFDDIKVSPCSYVYGTPITDWTSYTPTGSWSTNTTYTGRWRRVGDTLQSQVTIATSGAPTAADLTINYMPSGLSLDTTKISFTGGFAPLGYGTIVDSGTRVYNVMGSYNGGSSAYVSHTESGNTGLINRTNPMTWASGDQVSIFFQVPITGWSSSVQQSDSYSGREISTRLEAATTSIPNTGVYTLVQLSTIAFDKTGSGQTGASARINIPSSGIYDLRGWIQWSGTPPSAGFTGLALYKNGSLIQEIDLKNGTTGAFAGLNGGRVAELVAGDYIELRCSQNGSGSVTLANAYLEVSKRQAPTTISATETVAIEYNTTTAQSLSGSYAVNTIVYTNKVIDTHGAYSTSTGIFTAPMSGIYEITGSFVILSRAWATSDDGYINIYKNGSEVAQVYYAVDAAITKTMFMSIIPRKFSLVAGDTLKMGHIHGPAGSWTLSSSGTAVTTNLGIKLIK